MEARILRRDTSGLACYLLHEAPVIIPGLEQRRSPRSFRLQAQGSEKDENSFFRNAVARF